MLFPCGWPKAYHAFPPATDSDEIIAILPKPDRLLLASQRGLQIWSSGQNPTKLGQAELSQEDLDEVGLQMSVVWNPLIGSVVSLTDRGWLLFYLLKETKSSVLPPGCVSRTSKSLNIYQIYPAVCIGLHDRGLGSCIVSDGSIILVGMMDGSLQGYSWRELLNSVPQGSTWEWGEEDPSWFCGSVDPVTLDLSMQSYEDEDEREGDGILGIPNGSGPAPPAHGGVIHMDYCSSVQSLLMTFEDGSVALCMTAEWGLDPLEKLVLRQWICRGNAEIHDDKLLATCARVGDAAGLVAVGFQDGSVSTFRLSNFSRMSNFNNTISFTPVPSMPPVRSLTLADWGHNTEVTGAVHDIQWSQDCTTFATGYSRCGVAVWTPSGCRLMCSLPHTQSRASGNASNQPFSRRTRSSGLWGSNSDQPGSSVPHLQWGVSAMAWGEHQYRLWIAQVGVPQEMWELKFVKTPFRSNRVASTQDFVPTASRYNLEEVYILQADDRVLLVSEEASPPLSVGNSSLARQDSFDAAGGDQSQSNLALRHILLPQNYIADNWPVVLSSKSPDGTDIAAAGKRGLAIFSRKSEKWKLFGDLAQERAVSVQVMGWLQKIVVVSIDTAVIRDTPYSTSRTGDKPAELLLFPRYHLDFSSLLGRFCLNEKPTGLDCLDNYILVASQPLDILVLEVKIEGDVEVSQSPTATLTPVRELSIMAMEQPICSVILVRPRPDTHGNICENQIPNQCVILRWGGVLAVLDLEEGVETLLTTDVECCWLSDPPGKAKNALGVSSNEKNNTQQPTSNSNELEAAEMPWWAYGGRGMELWFPSSLCEPISPRKLMSSYSGLSTVQDPELEFDREVYPIGISLADASIIGVTQRMARASSAAPAGSGLGSTLPCFHPIPESQPVLPCLLRRLLQRGAFKEAKVLAQKHQELGLHFSRSLEWLLFTSLEFEGLQNTQNGKRPSTNSSKNNALLQSAAALIKLFPMYPDVVVSVARKTDVQYWPVLFDAVGHPSKLLEMLLRAGALHIAACLLIIIEQLEGEVLARALSMQLLEAALSSSKYDLVAELIRHLMSPSEFDTVFLIEASPRTNGENQEAIENDQDSRRTVSLGSQIWAWFWSTGDAADEEANPVSEECKKAIAMVQEHVRHVLHAGKLSSVSSLGRALAPLGSGLPALMSMPVVSNAQKENDHVTAQILIARLTTAVSEVFGHSGGALDVEVVLETCQKMEETAWTVALAILLDDVPVLSSFKAIHPDLWRQFVSEAKKTNQFNSLLDVIESVS